MCSGRIYAVILVSFVFLTNVRGSGLIESCPDGCRCIETRMVCETQIPVHVPSNVTCVELYAVNMAEYASDPPFNKTAWEHITELFINVNEFENGTTVIHHDAFTLRSKTLYQLQNLQHLSFINSNVQNMEPGTFAGVSALETLNFKGNVNLRISDFIVIWAVVDALFCGMSVVGSGDKVDCAHVTVMFSAELP